MDNKYYPVVYLTDGTIHLMGPHNTQEECLNLLKKIYETKWKGRMLRTTVIKRDVSNLKDGFLFGCPKSLNVCRTK